jgi:hypothetical protein
MSQKIGVISCHWRQRAVAMKVNAYANKERRSAFLRRRNPQSITGVAALTLVGLHAQSVCLRRAALSAFQLQRLPRSSCRASKGATAI